MYNYYVIKMCFYILNMVVLLIMVGITHHGGITHHAGNFIIKVLMIADEVQTGLGRTGRYVLP